MTTPWSATDSALRTFCSTSSTVRPVLVAQLAQQRHDLRGHPRGQAQRRLVEQQQPGPRDQGPAEGEHLPLAAGELVARRACGGGPAARTARTPRPVARCGVGAVRRHSPPRRRFSSTVSSATTPPALRARGPCRRRTSCSTAHAAQVWPSAGSRPALGRIRPDSVRSSVVLPAPLAPSTAVMEPAGTVEVDLAAAPARRRSRRSVRAPRGWSAPMRRGRVTDSRSCRRRHRAPSRRRPRRRGTPR